MLNERQVRILTEARALVARGWTQGPRAVDAEGNDVNPCSRTACAFCLAGSVQKAVGIDGKRHEYQAMMHGDYRSVMDALRRGDESCIDYNEAPGRTQEEVLQRMDETLARYRK